MRKVIGSVMGVLFIFFSPEMADAMTLLNDNFEYVVDRSEAGQCSNFTTNGWSGVKSENCTGRGSGYLYTTTSIPGFVGSFPGSGSNRVLGMEARPFTQQSQTDFYLQFGRDDGPIGQIPANHWVQFWIYLNDYGNEQSRLTQGKFLYFNRSTYYPASVNNDGYVYMVGLGKQSGVSKFLSPCGDEDSIGCQVGFMSSGWAGTGALGDAVFDNRCGYCGGLGQNLSNEETIIPNTWTLVKMHTDVSGADSRVLPGQVAHEIWIKHQGSSSWVKTAEWFGGVTPGCGASPVSGCSGDSAPITVVPSFSDGFRMMRMPTTVGATTSAKGDWFDYWIYMDDFTIATSESDLPVYETSTNDTTPPTSPTNLAANAMGETSITVSWDPSTDDIGVTGYQVERCLGLSCSNFSQVGTPIASPFIDTSLTASTGYSYHVRAVDAAGNTSGWSNVVSATTQGSPTFSSCSTVTPTNFTTSTYTGYGAPYDVFASNTPLISTQCSSTDTHTLTATLGIPGDTTRIVYTKGYYYDPGINDWTSFTGTCTGALNGEWCQGSVATSITDTDISTASVSDPSYLVGFTCRSQNGSWKCGCRDTACANFYWQVQGAGM